ILHRSLARRGQRVDDLDERLRTVIRTSLAARLKTRRTLEDKLRLFDLRPRFRRDRERGGEAEFRAISGMRAILARRRQGLATTAAKLEQLNPRLVLSRGYAIVLNETGEIVREASQAPPGSAVSILLERHTLAARITRGPEGEEDHEDPETPLQLLPIQR
ncbi:MAG TPA: exodeoxyribonuclease VII large subunit, partial [Bryobacteraceae bacterium]|nr:exodeoxyribonuclease VII large subunit [Bryobacteraceae bacterium]